MVPGHTFERYHRDALSLSLAGSILAEKNVLHMDQRGADFITTGHIILERIYQFIVIKALGCQKEEMIEGQG